MYLVEKFINTEMCISVNNISINNQPILMQLSPYSPYILHYLAY
jgi:hypothetical protein